MTDQHRPLLDPDRDRAVLQRFDRDLKTYSHEHPDASDAELMAYGELLQAAIPGFTEACRDAAARERITIALVQDRGDGLPVCGPSADYEDGERCWKLPELWSVEDYRVTLAWYRQPGCPADRLADLIAYGEARWPGEDISREPWPDIDDLPAWADLTRAMAELDDEDDDDEDLDDEEAEPQP